MRHLFSLFRLWLVHQVMKVMALLARVIQLGHPHKYAPTLRPEPSADETLGSFEGGKVYSFKNGIVSGERGGLAISGRNEVFSNLTHYFRGPQLHPGLVRLKVLPVRKLAGVGGYLCSPQARGNYYHWMIDLVPRLWLLEQAGFSAQTLDHVFVNGDDLPWEKDPLLAFGFRPDQIINCTEHDRFQVDRLIVPDQLQNANYFPPWKARFLNRLYPPASETLSRLLFCGRKGATWRRLLNEDDLFARLQPLGFERVDTSGMSVADQARLFSAVRIIVAVHGATLTNIVFAQAGAQLIEIQSRESPQTFYTSICDSVGIQSSVMRVQATRRGTDPVDLNRADFVLSAREIDSIFFEVLKELT